MDEKVRLRVFLVFGQSSLENTSAYKVSLISSKSFALTKLFISVKTLCAFFLLKARWIYPYVTFTNLPSPSSLIIPFSLHGL